MEVSKLVLSTLFLATLVITSNANFNNEFDITFGDGRARVLNNGEDLTLSLDKYSGSGFRSKNEYLFGKIDMQIKLVPGNSAGSVTTYYLSSMGSAHDEIDFEFLGNVTGQPYTLHTNVFAQGKGNREQQFHLWFDPTEDFHTYSILWNPQRIVFCGRVKADWSQSPFTVSFKAYKADACVWASGTSSCGPVSSTASGSGWLNQELDSVSVERMNWVHKNYMIYNYFADVQRFPQGLPTECSQSS